MKKYNIWVVYDTDTVEGQSEDIEVKAENMEQAVARLQDYNDLVSKRLPKDFEIHLAPTLDVNESVLTIEDRAFLASCNLAY